MWEFETHPDASCGSAIGGSCAKRRSRGAAARWGGAGDFRAAPRWIGLVVVSVVLVPGGAVWGQEAASQPTSRPDSEPALLAPAADILQRFRSDDPEQHVEAFAEWHTWRSTLESSERRAANRFVAKLEWFDVLGHVILYDFDGPRRRLTACKLAKRIGGQRLYPYFLWGLDETYEYEVFDTLGFLRRMLKQSDYMKSYLKRHGDPTVIEHLPEHACYDVIARINRRWEDKPAPEKTWEPLDVEGFVRDLLPSAPPPRRRLAIRALTTHGTEGGIVTEGRYRPLLTGKDGSVRLVAATALTVRPCPEARGLLKRMVEDASLSSQTRRVCIVAVVHCGKARRWTAEWLIDGLAEWPPSFDETVRESLVRLGPPPNKDMGDYAGFLRRRLRQTEDERTRRVVTAALKEMAE